MRLVVGFLLVLCACESRYGVYFNIDGDANQIHFNHVQLYFGKNGQTDNIGKPSGATMGEVFEHDADASDAFDVPLKRDGSFATESSYWLPIVDENLELDYVAAVAFDATGNPVKVVGAGELAGFKLEPGVVNKYDIELQKPDLAEVWGANNDCFAWTRLRDGHFTTVAVLSPDDLDCDGLVAGVDCNDLCPRGSTTCDPEATVCGTTSICGLGCVNETSCSIRTCLPDDACSDACIMKGSSLDARMNCIAANGKPHLTANVQLMQGTDKPCTRVINVPMAQLYQRDCAGVMEIWKQDLLDGWTLNVTNNSLQPGYCTVTMSNPNTAAGFGGDHHVLVAFPPRAGSMSMWSVMIGVRPDTQNLGCGSPDGFMIDAIPGTPNDCP